MPRPTRWFLPIVPCVLAACTAGDPGRDEPPVPAPFVAVTWNPGSGGLPTSGDPSGWTPEVAEISDRAYGNGLAWLPAVDRATAILAALEPDVVAFQEIFDPATGCPDMAEADRTGFVCETWQAGDPSVAQQILGDGWQVGCFPGKPDKCLAVREAWATIDGCDADRCDDAVRGAEVDGCGTGSRMGAVDVTLAAGGSLRIVGVHGTSGVSMDDMDCRARQAEAVLEGPDALAATPGVILGDLNTDPIRQAGSDPSADVWMDAVTDGPWSFASANDPDASPTYLALPVVSIDHILVGGVAVESCLALGIDDGPIDFPELPLWDHRPIACTLATGGLAAR